MYLKKIVTFLLFFLIFACFCHPLYSLSSDLGYYLLSGELITKTHTIFSTNLFSYTYPDYPFINVNWLSTVLLFLLAQAGGLSSLTIIVSIIALIIFLIILIPIYKTNSLFSLTSSSLLFISVFLERTEVKPELISYLFLSLFLLILYKYQKKITFWIFILPIIQLLWVNIHIYAILGPLVCLLFLIGEIFIKKELRNKRKIYILTLVLLLTLGVSCINPLGIQILIYPITALSSYGMTVTENLSPLIVLPRISPMFLGFISIIGIVFIGNIIYYKIISLTEKLLSIFFIFFGLLADRNIVIASIGIFYVLATILNQLPIEKTKKWIQITMALFLCCFYIYILQYSLKYNGFGLDTSSIGENAINFFVKNHLKGPIFNTYDIGNYIDYRLYPKEKVFIDGRPEAYPQSFFTNVYLPMLIDPNIFTKIENYYHFNTIIVKYKSFDIQTKLFIKDIANNQKWKLIYLDTNIAIFEKDLANDKTNKQTIIHIDFSKTTDLLSILQFFNLAGWEEDQKDISLKILHIDPKNCNALLNLINIYKRIDIQMLTFYDAQYGAFCQ